MNRSAAQMLDAWFAQRRAPRLTRRSAERLLTVAAHGGERSRRSQAHAAHQRCGRRPTVDAQWRCAGSAAATRRECGNAQVRDDSSSASRRAKQNDASAQPCPARPSRACLASRTNRVPVVTRIGGRGDGAAVDDGPLCRRRADAAAPSSRGRDLGGRGPQRRVLRQTDGGKAQTSLSWLADTLLSQDRAASIRFCRPTGGDPRRENHVRRDGADRRGGSVVSSRSIAVRAGHRHLLVAPRTRLRDAPRALNLDGAASLTPPELSTSRSSTSAARAVLVASSLWRPLG